MILKEAIIKTPILHYPDPVKRYIVYMDALDYACGAQLSQEHDGAKFPIAFLYHALLKHRENGVPQNKKLTDYTVPSPSGTTTFKELTS